MGKGNKGYKGYKGHPRFSRKRGRDEDDEDRNHLNDDDKDDDRRSYGSRHKGSYPMEEIIASEAYKSTDRTCAPGPKRKYAICLGYLGTNYRGLQINPDTKSIEAELEKSLFLSGGISMDNFGFLQKIQWSRSARTDAGVHAVSQCCAMRLSIPGNKKQQFIEAVNSHLPPDIRVHAISKVTKAFNAKLFCTKRRYQYLLPTYLLSNQQVVEQQILEILGSASAVVTPYTTFGDNPGESSKTVPVLSGASLQLLHNTLKPYRITAELLATLRSSLQTFIGTHNFHNYTSGKLFSDSNAKRYILSFDCGDPFIARTGVEYVLLSVIGQSFLLNQIRKMVAMAVEVARGRVAVGAIEESYTKQVFDIPMAPGVGLYLDELFFDGYHLKIDEITVKGPSIASTASVEEDGNEEDDDKSSGLAEKLDWHSVSDTAPLLKRFREEMIWEHIYSEEGEGKYPFVSYLDFLRISKHKYLFDGVKVYATTSDTTEMSHQLPSGECVKENDLGRDEEYNVVDLDTR